MRPLVAVHLRVSRILTRQYINVRFSLLIQPVNATPKL